jgi:hypothetical protein
MSGSSSFGTFGFRRGRLPVRLSAAALVVLLAAGCHTVRPVANTGYDLLENPGRPQWARIPAGFGALVGYVVATPVSLVLLPTMADEDLTVENSQGYGPGRERGDIRIPLVQAPYDTCGGVGAAALGWPFGRLTGLLYGSPPVPPGSVNEVPEALHSELDPGLDFTTTPPRPHSAGKPAARVVPRAEAEETQEAESAEESAG